MIASVGRLFSTPRGGKVEYNPLAHTNINTTQYAFMTLTLFGINRES